ncbi:hypothetical protein U6B65_12925 [Oscillospiraceae bacterium MB08-C2-2]|nr:hypothetical protein U6B65_12925 [Oscillospiraceae bacterium MB08-C2-2]
MQMDIKTTFAHHHDIDIRTALVGTVENHSLGLDKKQYRQSLMLCIEKNQAICAKLHGKTVGILLFSTHDGVLAF